MYGICERAKVVNLGRVLTTALAGSTISSSVSYHYDRMRPSDGPFSLYLSESDAGK